MGRSRTYRKVKASRAATLALHVRHLRCRRLLWKAREIARLRRDGIEKLEGGFILDRHYVETLVDRALHLAGKACHDAALLNLDHGQALLGDFDRQRDTANRLMDAEPAPAGPVTSLSGDSSPDEPEYRLLARAIDWIGTPEVSRPESLWSLVNRAASLATGRFREQALPSVTDELALPAHDASHQIALIETEVELETKQRSDAGPDSIHRLLALLFDSSASIEAGADVPVHSGPRPTRQRSWQAISAGRYLSVYATDDHPAVRLDIILGDRPGEDLLFMLLPGAARTQQTLPDGIVPGCADGNALGWCLDLSAAPNEVRLRDLSIWIAAMANT